MMMSKENTNPRVVKFLTFVTIDIALEVCIFCRIYSGRAV